MAELKKLPPHLIGGNFLLAETEPAQVFTPEDLTSEQRMMAQTAEKFMEKEVMPNLEALEHQKDGIAPELFRKAAKLGLVSMEISLDYGGLGLNKVTGIGVAEQLTRLGGFGVTAGAHS